MITHGDRTGFNVLRRTLSVVSLVIMLSVMSTFAIASPSLGNGQVVSGATVSAFAATVVGRMTHDTMHVYVPVGVCSDQHLPVGHLVLRHEAPLSMSATFVGIPVSIVVDGHLVRQIVVNYRYVAYRIRPIATHDLAAGSILQASDFIDQKMPDDGRGYLSLEQLVGRRLSVSLSAGDTPTLAETISNPVVHAGDAVVYIVHDGDVALHADVSARSTGAIGDTVLVYDAEEQKTLSGVVTGPDRVELTLAETESE